MTPYMGWNVICRLRKYSVKFNFAFSKCGSMRWDVVDTQCRGHDVGCMSCLFAG